MSKSLLLMLCLVTGLLALACAQTAETNRNAVTPASATSPVPAGTPSTNTNATAGAPIGIAECDSFLTAYDNCVSNKVPENIRAQYKTAIENWRTQWKRLADNPQTRSTLAAVCKQQMETARAQVQAFGCTF